jgi:hypothetical protein
MSSRPRQSLHIGCPAIECGWTYLTWDLVADAPDEAEAGRAVAADRGFDPAVVLDTPKAASKEAVLQQLELWKQIKEPVDVFLTYVGHGTTRSLGRAERSSPCEEEDPGFDEFLVLNGGGLCDNALAATWAGLTPGSRVLFVANCCHGGGVASTPPALQPFFTTPEWLTTAALFLEGKFTKSFECSSPQPTTFASTVILIASSPPDGSSQSGLMSALKDALGSNPKNYQEWIDTAQLAFADNIFTCKFGPEAKAMWSAPPLAYGRAVAESVA